MLHALSGANDGTACALLSRGTIICSPTEAIVYHKDNMIKLPSTMTLLQAARKVVDVVDNGIDTPCPICLQYPSATEPTVFMPCECKVSIHLSCMQQLMDNNIVNCPVCRTTLGKLETR